MLWQNTNGKTTMRKGTPMKTLRFLWVSLVAILALCTAVFACLTTFMSTQNSRTISEVGEVYMNQTGAQINLHFKTAVELYETKLEGVTWRTPQLNGEGAAEAGFAAAAAADLTAEQTRTQLAADAQEAGFSYLALYSPDGTYDVLHGTPAEVDESASFIADVLAGTARITDGAARDGSAVVLLGESAAYPLADGGESVAIVAGIPMQELVDTLSLNIGETQIYSHIIRTDGSFVLRSEGVNGETYFDRIRTGDEHSGKPNDQIIAEVQHAMAAGDSYSIINSYNGEMRNAHLSPLPYTSWYLVSVLPYELLNAPLTDLMNQRTAGTAVGAGVILAAILGIFFLYFRNSRRQMDELTAAKNEADQANLAKSAFLSSMSHDIRTPMNAITGMAAIASKDPENRQVVRDCLNKITISSRHLLGLINDVLDMSKIESGKMTLRDEDVSLRDVAEGLVGIVQSQVKSKQQRFDVVVDHVLAERVRTDGVRLNQVLLNLLSNAQKFTPEGGSVLLTMQQSPSPRGPQWVRTRFWVKDTGIGMSPEFQQHVFESFEREDNRVRTTEGTGLGMAICKRIVDAMDGQIEVDSAVGQGTTFTVTLDFARSTVPEQRMALPREWSMLVVDDDDRLCRATCETLGELGIQAEWTTAGRDAVHKVARRASAHVGYNAVLLDWQMPTMSGLDTARAIRAEVGEDTPILLVSAYDWSEVEPEAREAGIDGFVSKPLFKSTLYHALQPFANGEGAGCGDGNGSAVGLSGVSTDECAAGARAAGSVGGAGAAAASGELVGGNAASSAQHGAGGDAAAGKIGTSAAADDGDLAGMRILVAEDNEINWEVAKGLLETLGCELEWAPNGRACVEMFEAEDRGRYDAILMDVRMPDMDGFEATRAIRVMADTRPDAAAIPIVAMTADAFAEDIEKCRAAGMDAHVAKPINLPELARTVSELVRERRAEERPRSDCDGGEGGAQLQ